MSCLEMRLQAKACRAVSHGNRTDAAALQTSGRGISCCSRNAEGRISDHRALSLSCMTAGRKACELLDGKLGDQLLHGSFSALHILQGNHSGLVRRILCPVLVRILNRFLRECRSLKTNDRYIRTGSALAKTACFLKFIVLRADVHALLDRNGFRQRKDCCRSGLIRRISDSKLIVRLFQNPGCFLLAVGCEKLHGNGDTDLFPFSRSKKLRLRIALQLKRRMIQFGISLYGNIDLYGFFSFHASRICHRSKHPDLTVLHAAGNRLHGKACIGKSVAKRIQRLFPEGFKVTISDIDAFRIVIVIRVTVIVRKVCRRRIIGIACRPGICQLSGRIHLTRQDIGNGKSSDVAKL